MKIYKVDIVDAWGSNSDKDYHTWYFIDKTKADEIMKKEKSDMVHNYYYEEIETDD